MASFVNTSITLNRPDHFDLSFLKKSLSRELYRNTNLPTQNSLLRILNSCRLFIFSLYRVGLSYALNLNLFILFSWSTLSFEAFTQSIFDEFNSHSAFYSSSIIGDKIYQTQLMLAYANWCHVSNGIYLKSIIYLVKLIGQICIHGSNKNNLNLIWNLDLATHLRTIWSCHFMFHLLFTQWRSDDPVAKMWNCIAYNSPRGANLQRGSILRIEQHCFLHHWVVTLFHNVET